jgi:hypothetical protein
MFCLFYNYTGKTYENLLVRKINFLTIRKPFMPGNRYIFILFNDGFYIAIWHSFSFILWNEEWRLTIIEQGNAVYCIFLKGLLVPSVDMCGLWYTWSEKSPRYILGFSDLDHAERAVWETRVGVRVPITYLTGWVVIEICSVCDKVVCKEIPLCIKVPKII